MLVDIVVDANVLMHADNPQELRYQNSRALLQALEGCTCTVRLCVDEGFSVDEADNRSHIGSEYLKHLRFGMLGFSVVTKLAGSLRVKQVPRGVPQNVSRQIRQVPRGPDRTYVQVAFNSHDKTLASHDFTDIPATVRRRLRGAIGVSILDAAGSLALL